jgi:hypothetical protein
MPDPLTPGPLPNNRLTLTTLNGSLANQLGADVATSPLGYGYAAAKELEFFRATRPLDNVFEVTYNDPTLATITGNNLFGFAQGLINKDDANNDGFVDITEALTQNGSINEFAVVDADKSGKLDRKEAATLTALTDGIKGMLMGADGDVAFSSVGLTRQESAVLQQLKAQLQGRPESEFAADGKLSQEEIGIMGKLINEAPRIAAILFDNVHTELKIDDADAAFQGRLTAAPTAGKTLDSIYSRFQTIAPKPLTLPSTGNPLTAASLANTATKIRPVVTSPVVTPTTPGGTPPAFDLSSIFSTPGFDTFLQSLFNPTQANTNGGGNQQQLGMLFITLLLLSSLKNQQPPAGS